MPRDYVNDFGRPDPKNRSRRRGGRPQGSGGGKSNAITFLAIIVLILLCAVFFLASRSGLLKGGSGDQAAPAAQKTEKPKQEQEAKTPERPKEKYDYMQLLESNEVVGETNDPKKADKTQKPHNAEIMDKPASTVDVRRENKQEEAKRAQEILNGSLNTRDESVTVLNDRPSSPSAPSGSGLSSETVTVERPPKMQDSEAALAESRKADAERQGRADSSRRLEEQRKAEEQKRLAAQRQAEQKKAEADRKAEEQKLAAQRKAEADRKAAEQKLAEQKKAEADRKAAELRLAEQKKADVDRRAAEQKLAEQKRIESEKQAAAQKQQAAQGSSAGSAGDGRVYLQCAAFRTAQQADTLKSKLRAGGFPAFVQQANVGGSVWYRVKLGPYRSAATASKSSSAVVSSGIAGACAISR